MNTANLEGSRQRRVERRFKNETRFVFRRARERA